MRVCNNSSEVMVYGFENCDYLAIQDILRAHKVHVYDYTCGNFLIKSVTAIGTYLHQIKYPRTSDPIKDESRQCKMGITNIVLENYKRIKTGTPIIPILLCIGIDGHPLNAEIFVFSKKYTCREARRVFKHCKMIEDEDLREVANKTFKCVAIKKVKVIQSCEERSNPPWILKEIAFPWDSEQWGKCWQKKQTLKASQNGIPLKKLFFWEKKLKEEKSTFDAEINISLPSKL